MKILSILFLTGFFAVLLVPAITWAAACPVCQPIPQGTQCQCGSAFLTPGLFCGANGSFIDANGNAYTQASCLAASGGSTTGGGTQPSQTAPTVITSAQGLIDLVERIGNWIFAFLLAVAAVFLIYAGFKWVTAGGNPEEVNKARLMLINALIGVAIALLARGMVMVIRGIIGG